MAENKEMTIEEALETLIDLAQEVASNMDFNRDIFGIWEISGESANDYRQAADVLRQIGEPVERSEVVTVKWWCDNCHQILNLCDCRKTQKTRPWVKCTKHWTETQVLKRVIEKSEPVYEPVTPKNEGGRDE